MKIPFACDHEKYTTDASISKEKIKKKEPYNFGLRKQVIRSGATINRIVIVQVHARQRNHSCVQYIGPSVYIYIYPLIYMYYNTVVHRLTRNMYIRTCAFVVVIVDVEGEVVNETYWPLAHERKKKTRHVYSWVLRLLGAFLLAAYREEQRENFTRLTIVARSASLVFNSKLALFLIPAR